MTEAAVDKHILTEYSDMLARVTYLRRAMEKIEAQKDRLNEQGYYVVDSVTRGKRGKRALGSVIIAGFPYPEYDRLCKIAEIRSATLLKEEQKLLELIAKVEDYITGVTDIEMRNILSLYYIENLNWIQVAHRMNNLYRKKKAYTDSSCRRKHERFLEKI